MQREIHSTSENRSVVIWHVVPDYICGFLGVTCVGDILLSRELRRAGVTPATAEIAFRKFQSRRARENMEEKEK